MRRSTLAVVALSLVACIASAAEEGTYKGKPAAEWAPLLKDKDKGTRLEAITALVEIGKDTDTKPLVERVRELVDDEDLMIRAKAARWLAVVTKDKRLVKTLIDLFDWDRPQGAKSIPTDVRTEAILAIVSLGPTATDALPILERQWSKLSDLITSDSPGGREAKATQSAIKSIKTPPADH